MLTRNGALLLAGQDAIKARPSLPTSKWLSVRGKQILAVRHTLDAVKVLRNIGLQVPDAIDHSGYEYTGRFKPMAHQIKTVKFLVNNSRAYNFSEMGTGKTSAALWATDYLMTEGLVRRVLVVCPLSVAGVWSQEAFSTTPHRDIALLIGARQKRLSLIEMGAEIFVVNFDGVVSIKGALARWSPDLIIVDEASAYRNAQTKRWRALHSILKPDTRMWMLTGTPTPNAPTDCYGLIKMCRPWEATFSFKLCQERLMRPYGPYKWIPRVGSSQMVNEMLQPAVRFTKADCLDLPAIAYQDRVCSLSSVQAKAFEEMRLKMKLEDEGRNVTAANAAVKIWKLQQIICGVVKDAEGNAVELNPKPRLEALTELVAGASHKVIVFVPFIHSMHMVQRALDKHWSTALVYGAVSGRRRDEIFWAFQSEADPRVLIAHPRVAAHGRTLTKADTIIWFGPTYSTERYAQANARIDRNGQKNSMNVYHLISHPFEVQIYKVLNSKVSMQSKLLSLYSELQS